MSATAAARAEHRTAIRISELLATFKLPTAAEEMVARLTDHADALPALLEVLGLEADARRDRRVERLRRASHLAHGRTFATFDDKRLPPILARTLKELARGDFAAQAIDVLAFGLPGTGKSHAACALGHALVEAGRSVLFTRPTPSSRSCCAPSAISSCPGRRASSTSSMPSSSTNGATAVMCRSRLDFYGFRRVRGHADMSKLNAALDRAIKHNSPDRQRKAA